MVCNPTKELIQATVAATTTTQSISMQDFQSLLSGQ
jgi:hypothetical protein